MCGYAFPAYTGEIIDFAYAPAFRVSVVPCALFVVLRTFATSLIFSRNANPDTNAF